MDAVDKGHAKIGATGRSGSDIVCTGGGTGNIRLELPFAGMLRQPDQSALAGAPPIRRDDGPIQSVQQYLGDLCWKIRQYREPLRKARKRLEDAGFTEQTLRDEIVSSLVRQAERIEPMWWNQPTAKLQQQRPKNRQNPDQQGYRVSHYDCAAGVYFLADDCRCESSFPMAERRLILDRRGWQTFFAGLGRRNFCAICWFTARVSHLGVGGIGYAAAHGHLLPFVYSIGRFGLSAPGSI